MSRDKSTAIGIDIGGSKIAVAAIDLAGRICARISLPTQAERGFDNAVARIAKTITEVALEAEWPAGGFSGIGIGCAGPVDPLRGTIHNPYTLPGWDNCNIVARLQEKFVVPVRLENDADSAALGECFVGAGRGFDPVVMLTFGTGIGGATIVAGRIFRGALGGHPEIGHIPVQIGGPVCYCGAAGCFESLASGAAIGAAGSEFGFADSHEVFAATARGHTGARAIVERAVRATAAAAWTIIHTLMPQRIILGGGLMDKHYGLFAEAMRQQIAPATMIPSKQLSVAKAVLGNDAGLVGAASLVFSSQSLSLDVPGN